MAPLGTAHDVDVAPVQCIVARVGVGERGEAVRGEAVERGDEMVEQARDDARARRLGRERGEVDRRLVDHVRRGAEAQVDAETDHRMARAERVAAEFDEDAAELGATRDEIVRPLERDAVDAARGERVDRSDTDREAESGERGHAGVEALEQGQRDAAAGRRVPAPTAATAAGGLDLGEAGEQVARIVLGAAQQLAAGRVELPVHGEIAEPCRWRERMAQRRLVEQFERRAEAIAAAGLRLDLDAGFAQALDLLPDRRARYAEALGQRTAGHRTVRTQLGKDRAGTRLGGGGRSAGAGFGHAKWSEAGWTRSVAAADAGADSRPAAASGRLSAGVRQCPTDTVSGAAALAEPCRKTLARLVLSCGQADWSRDRDRASIAASSAAPPGNPAMNKTAILFIVLGCSMSAAGAHAQSAPLRGASLLALNTTDARAGATVVERIDSGGGSGGSTGARALRGSDITPRATQSESEEDATAPLPDPLPKPIAGGDPSAPAAATPKRPSYRWQSLVPGAIK